MSVYLSVCLSACIHVAELHQIFVIVACGHGLVSSDGICDMLYISGFVDNVIFSHNGPVVCYVYYQVAIEHDKYNSEDSNQVLLNNKEKQVL